MARNKDKVIVGAIIASAIVIFIIVSVAVLYFSSRSEGLFLDSYSLSGRVAIVDVKGVIESSDDVVRQLKKYHDDSSIKALVLRVDSPGGGVAASQEIYDQLLKFKNSGKFIVISMGSIAASGGYYIACAGDTIMANPGTLTGSIGVLYSFPTFTRLMDKVGVELEVFKSGDLKDVGNYARNVTDKDRKMLQSVIDDTYNQFVEVITNSRNLNIDDVKKLADGSVFTGLQAQKLGLIDEIGTLEDAIGLAGVVSDLGDDPKTIKEHPRRKPIWELASEFLGIGKEFIENRAVWPAIEYRYTF